MEWIKPKEGKKSVFEIAVKGNRRLKQVLDIDIGSEEAKTMRTRKSWREKLEKEEGLPKIVEVPAKWEKRFGKGKMLVPKPLDVDALIRTVKKGKLVTVTQLRQRLAKDFGVDHACPLTTGIFVRIAAEDLKEGRKRVTPYWRVLKSDGSLNPKYPGGVNRQADYLKAEGHLIERTGKKKPPRVKDYEKRLQRL